MIIGGNEVNWAEIEAEYVNSKISLRALADKYNVPLGNIQKRSAKGKWSEKRKKYSERKAEKVSESVNDKEIKQTVKDLNRLMKSAGKLLTMVNRAIGQLDKDAYIAYDEQEISQSESDDGGVTTVKSVKKRKMKTARMNTLVDAKRASELAKSLLNLKEVLTGDNGQAENSEHSGVIILAEATGLDPRPGEEEDESDLETAAEAGADDVAP